MSKVADSIQNSDSVNNVAKTNAPRPHSSSSFLPARTPLVAGSHSISNISKPLIQPKLKIGAPNDKYEQEADRVADQVMGMPESHFSSFSIGQPPNRNGRPDGGIIQRISTSCPKEQQAAEKESRPIISANRYHGRIQTKSLAETIFPSVQRQESEQEEEKTIQAKSAGQAPAIIPNMANAIQSLRGGGRTLPDSSKIFFESRFGQGFSKVRIHAGSQAALLARSINARAFTLGQDMVFGAGQYRPQSSEGKRLMAHELTHVLQQSGRRLNGDSNLSGREIKGWNSHDAYNLSTPLIEKIPKYSYPQITSNLSSKGFIRRDPEGDETTSGESESVTLTNPRFLGDRDLERILTGQIAALSSGQNGRRRAVSKVQQALVDLGFELPMHRVDGSYGDETEAAIRQFRAQHGPSEGSSLDGATLAVLDRIATLPGVRQEHTVDYDRLLADGRLDVTVAIGATDETVSGASPGDPARPVEELQAERFRAWMTSYGFNRELLGWAGNQYWKATRTIDWTGSDGTEHSREVDIWINLIVPTTGASREFREGLSSDEITIYSGHARYGSGPDFDAKASPLENFRIGIDTAQQAAGRRTRVEEARRHGVVIDQEHDLLEMVNSGNFDPEAYRVLFFSACTSLAYLDEVREHIGGPENTDVVATRRPSLFTTAESEVGVAEVQRFLEGILGAESVESIVNDLDEAQRQLHQPGTFPRGGIYSSSGLGDNPRTN